MNATDSSNRAALTCFAHLEHEEAMLRDTLDMLQAIRQALLERNFERLATALQRQQRVARAAVELRAKRDRLRDWMAATLKTAASELTLSVLLEHLGEPLQGQLRCRQQKLSEMARQVHLLNHGNAQLIRQSMDLLRQLLDGLTGTDQGPPRYTSHGRIERGERGSTFQKRC